MHYMCQHPLRPEEGFGLPGTGISNGFEMPSVGAGNRTQSSAKASTLNCELSVQPLSTSRRKSYFAFPFLDFLANEAPFPCFPLSS